MHKLQAMATAGFLLAVSGCGDDSLAPVCVTQDNGFDIEQVSALEDNWGWHGLQDAIMLTYAGPPASTNPKQESTWRVRDVQVLVMIGQSEFNTYADDALLRVEVFDASNLRGATPYVLGQRLVKSALSWSDHSFTSDPTGATSDPSFIRERDYRTAWWTFDFSGIIPESGMQSLTYGVAVSWPDSDYPLVGYSQFNRSCKDNWTNYDTALPTHSLTGTGWASNGDRFQGDVCNWPMLKVDIERRAPCTTP